MKDASGKYASVVKVIPKDFSRWEQDNNGSGGIGPGPFVVNDVPFSPIDGMER